MTRTRRRLAISACTLGAATLAVGIGVAPGAKLKTDVLVLFTFHGRGRDGVEARLTLANLVTLRSGLARRHIGFPDWQEALEAAGLSEYEQAVKTAGLDDPHPLRPGAPRVSDHRLPRPSIAQRAVSGAWLSNHWA
jgi:hypothetical protein